MVYCILAFSFHIICYCLSHNIVLILYMIELLLNLDIKNLFKKGYVLILPLTFLVSQLKIFIFLLLLYKYTIRIEKNKVRLYVNKVRLYAHYVYSFPLYRL